MDGAQPLYPSPERTGERAGGHNATPAATLPLTRSDCLELLLLAFRDVADRDDIHQADQRLKLVRRWIRTEAAQAAADPVFAEPARLQRRPVSNPAHRRQPAAALY